MEASFIKKFQDKAVEAVVEEIWDQYDHDGNGELDPEEALPFFRDTMQLFQGDFTDEEFMTIFNFFDLDRALKLDSITLKFAH